MDSARHVITRMLNPRLLGMLAWHPMTRRMMDSARHIIKRMLNPRFLNDMASYDVASALDQSLREGGRTVGAGVVAKVLE
jgi:hypothetical protein